MAINSDWSDYAYSLSPSTSLWYTLGSGGSLKEYGKNVLDPGRFLFGNNDKNSDTYAQDTRASILRSQWGDWKARFAPLEDRLLDSYKNPNVRDQAQEQGADLFQRGFDASQASADRRLASYGLSLTPEQQASRDRSTDLAHGLGQVSAFNNTQRAISARDDAMLTGLAGSARPNVGGG